MRFTLPHRTNGPGRPLLAGAAVAVLALAALASLSAVQLRPTGHAVTPSDVPAPPSGWSTLWSDDFTGAAGTGLDTANWLYDTGTSYPGGAAHWGTNEVETVTDSTDNVYHDGSGNLVIKPIRSGSSWTSGRVESRRTDLAAPAGGQLEVTASIRQPDPASGLGYWPAFWMLGADARPVGATNWPGIGEIDIMEDVNAASQHASTLHCGVDPGGPCNETTGIGSGLQACSGCQTGYHTYSVIVDRTDTSAEQIRWYLDGTNFFTVNQSQMDATTWHNAVDHGFFLILNVAIGGAFPDAICGCTSPAADTSSGAGMSVDYVAAYQTGAGTPSSPPPGGDTDAYSTIQAEGHDGASSVSAESTTDSGGGEDVGQLADGGWLRYDDVQFGSTPATQFVARVASGAGGGVSGLVQVRLDSPTATPVGSFAVGNTGGWQSWRTVPANITTVTGRHTVYLTFDSGQPAPFVSLNWFTFGH